MSGTKPAININAVDTSLNQILDNYLSIVEASNRISLASLVPFFTLYWKSLRWELCVLIVPVVILLNVIFGRAVPYLSPKNHQWGRWVVLKAKEPVLYLHQGEMPVMQFLVLRGAVRLLLYVRLGTALTTIIRRLQELKIKHKIEANQATFDFEWYERRISLLKDAKDIVGSKLGLTFWSTVISMGTIAGALYGGIKGILSLIPADLKGAAIVMVKSSPIVANWIPHAGSHGQNLSSDRVLLLILIALSVLLYVMWTVVTNFLVMRSLLHERLT